VLRFSSRPIRDDGARPAVEWVPLPMPDWAVRGGGSAALQFLGRLELKGVNDG
jgi:hypothetical protein